MILDFRQDIFLSCSFDFVPSQSRYRFRTSFTLLSITPTQAFFHHPFIRFVFFKRSKRFERFKNLFLNEILFRLRYRPITIMLL